MNTVNNISLVTSDGREPVYIRVFGQEKDGSYFERQLPYLIKPKLIDLQLRGHPTTDIVRPEEPLEMRFRLINRGQADTFLINASVDNQKFTVSVSPAQIRLGHLSSFVGRIVVGVQLSTGEATGFWDPCVNDD
nr:hypothetical protein BaRGS_034487 [Batillaria attramentaria]